MSDEVWQPIPSARGYYEASDQGRIRSFHRGWAGRVMKPTLNTWTGYWNVTLMVDGEKRLRRVHRLVAEAFHGLAPEGLVTRHLDGDKNNNAASNLCYGTHTENALDKVAHGQCWQSNKTHCVAGHEYTPENTAINRRKDGRTGRYCRTCHNVAVAASRLRRKAAA